MQETSGIDTKKKQVLHFDKKIELYFKSLKNYYQTQVRIQNNVLDHVRSGS